jgi:hypothetical protein
MPNLISPPSPARRSTLLSFALLSLLPLSACASDMRAAPPPVRMSVVDRETGQVLVLVLYQKDGRNFVAGKPGARYAIRLHNQTGARVLVVLAVDGVNVISGHTASWQQTGYVLSPYGATDISGWRKSETAVAAFEFAALSDSYAARTGRPDNVGVMGMAVFFEKPQPVAAQIRVEPNQMDADKPAAADAASGSVMRREAPAPAAAAAPQKLAEGERLGTAHGQREWSVSRSVNFERLSSSPQSTFEVMYDSYTNLVAAGVIPSNVAQAPWPPRAFPRSANDDQRRFVPDPPAQ